MHTLFSTLDCPDGIAYEAQQYIAALLEILDHALLSAAANIDPEKISRVIRLIEALNHDILPRHGDSAAGGTA